MDFDFTDDQLALRDGARELLDDLASPARVRAHTAGHDAFDATLWSAMVEQGWLGIELAEADGGVGLGSIEAALLCEEVGRHAAPAGCRAAASRRRRMRHPPRRYGRVAAGSPRGAA